MLSKLRQVAFNLLARREHSKFELKNKLIAKGFADDDIDKLLFELAEKGLQSDIRFIENYIMSRSRRGFGPRRIRGELCEKGIDQVLSDKFLDENDLSWFDLAVLVKNKKYGEGNPESLSVRAKQMNHLYYKGFNSDHIKNVFKCS